MSAAQVMTVAGAVSADDLGVTLVHEHVFSDLRRDAFVGNNLLSDDWVARHELDLYAAAGGRTIVDQTSRGLGQRPDKLRRLAEETGLNIVLGCGWYREPYYAPELGRLPVDAIAEQMVVDVTEGIDGTGVRAGLIGEVGSHEEFVSPAEERVLRAAARAHLETGVTIATHSPGQVGLWQLDILEEEGVDPRRVVIGHAQSCLDTDYHLTVADRGAFLSFDRMGVEGPLLLRLLELVRPLTKAGYLDRLLLSHDVCYKADLTAYGGGGYAHLLGAARAVLENELLGEEGFLHVMTVNPRNALTGQ